ncbi:MAG: RNA-directed DNA polymerase [Patescibacteria group bacterium]
MPLGNYTSQFFANVYLNPFDYFVKHVLKTKHYIRYVDDFVIIHNSKEQLERWKEQINSFLKEKLKLELHPQKSRIIPLSRGVDFIGFRNFAHFKLLRKRNIKNIYRKINAFKKDKKEFRPLLESYQGWQAHARWANTYKLREKVKRKIIDVILEKL